MQDVNQGERPVIHAGHTCPFDPCPSAPHPTPEDDDTLLFLTDK